MSQNLLMPAVILVVLAGVIYVLSKVFRKKSSKDT